MRILLAEDNEMIRAYLELILREEGHDVVATSDGDAAWRVFEEMGRDLDLVLTDVGMPGIRGDDLVRRVRQTSNVACILMSGSELLSELPVVAVLRKPFGREDLLDAVAKAATGSTESRA